MPRDPTILLNCFNSQPRKEADGINSEKRANVCRFNSQPRKEADDFLMVDSHNQAVSTHSLARRLTPCVRQL